MSIHAQAVALNSQEPSLHRIGQFVFAGGLHLIAAAGQPLHELSDIEVIGQDRLLAVTDFGMWFEARLVHDQGDRLVGIADTRMWPMTGEDGRPLSRREDMDAEGLARLPNGDLLVSFERHHRIWLYPVAQGGPPKPVPMPELSMPSNTGLEALSADPEAAADAYLVGAEGSAQTWRCRQKTVCTLGPVLAIPENFSLVAIRQLLQDQTAYLLRAFDPLTGLVRVSLRLQQADRLIAQLDLAPPLTVDNFEGLAAVRRTDGGWRFYLMSDDNGSQKQRTLLLAFDWMPS